MKYVIMVTTGNSWVKLLTLTAEGIVIDYTPKIEEAAKVSVKATADNLAKCVPMGKAVPYYGP